MRPRTSSTTPTRHDFRLRTQHTTQRLRSAPTRRQPIIFHTNRDRNRIPNPSILQQRPQTTNTRVTRENPRPSRPSFMFHFYQLKHHTRPITRKTLNFNRGSRRLTIMKHATRIRRQRRTHLFNRPIRPRHIKPSSIRIRSIRVQQPQRRPQIPTLIQRRTPTPSKQISRMQIQKLRPRRHHRRPTPTRPTTRSYIIKPREPFTTNRTFKPRQTRKRNRIFTRPNTRKINLATILFRRRHKLIRTTIRQPRRRTPTQHTIRTHTPNHHTNTPHQQPNNTPHQQPNPHKPTPRHQQPPPTRQPRQLWIATLITPPNLHHHTHTSPHMFLTPTKKRRGTQTQHAPRPTTTTKPNNYTQTTLFNNTKLFFIFEF
jgi:hypothetical protein